MKVWKNIDILLNYLYALYCKTLKNQTHISDSKIIAEITTPLRHQPNDMEVWHIKLYTNT